MDRGGGQEDKGHEEGEVKMVKEFACRKCKTITTEKVCPNCHSMDLTTSWFGYLVIIDPEKSEVAKLLGIKKPGRYALKVS